MSVLDGPGEGTWSVFAQKVVEQRDAAIARADELTRDLDEVTTALSDAHTREATLRAENKRLTECNEAMREPMRRLRDAMGMPAQGEGYVVDSIIKERDEALRLLATRVEAKRLDEAQEEIERLRETLQALVDEKLVCNRREADGSYTNVSAWCRAVLNGEKP